MFKMIKLVQVRFDSSRILIIYTVKRGDDDTNELFSINIEDYIHDIILKCNAMDDTQFYNLNLFTLVFINAMNLKNQTTGCFYHCGTYSLYQCPG